MSGGLRLGMRFLCRRCGALFYQETAPLRPLQEITRVLFDQPGMPEAVARTGAARVVGQATIWADLAGNYRVEMRHDTCGYKGPAVDATEAEMPRRGSTLMGPE